MRTEPNQPNPQAAAKRLRLWLNGRKVHKGGTTVVVAEARDYTSSRYTLAEADITAILDERDVLIARVAELAGKQPADDSAREPVGGWILWDPEGRWMHTTAWTLDANRNDDGWKAVSINEAEGREFRAKGCLLDELDQAGWRAFDELRGTTNAAGSRDRWLARCAALNADKDGVDR